MTKDEAREHLSKMIVTMARINPVTNSMEISLPVYDQNMFTGIETNKNGDVVYSVVTFRHLIKTVYDLKEN
jgi:hypothetical protein